MDKKIPIREETDNPSVNIALDTIKIGKQALIFVNTKRSAEKTAEDISKKIKTADPELEKLSYEVLNALTKPTKQCERLAYCVKKGIAFHHAGLTQKQKELIEDSFRNFKIRIICCTPTLAMGVDLPAFRSVLRDLQRYGGPRGMHYISVLEAEQMWGRAGRPSFDNYGEAICIAETEAQKEKIKDMYINGEIEDIYSKLAVEPVLRTYILSLIAANFVNSKKELLDFFSKTFWAYQFEDMAQLEKIINKMLDLLEEFEFITMNSRPSEFVSAKDISKDSIEATKLGERVAQLYIDPLTAHNIIVALRRGSSKQLNEFSFLQLVSNCLEMRPMLRVRSKEQDLIQEKIAEYESFLISFEPSIYDPEYDIYMDSMKTALFFNEWIEENDEEYLLEHYDIRPGEIRVKLDLADWLLYSTEELAKLLHFQDILKHIMKTRFRLRYGVKEELLPLLRLHHVGRVRARKLFNHKIKDVADIKKADLTTLAQILGKETALKVKEQVGQDVSKEIIPEGKRKGQISLFDYDE